MAIFKCKMCGANLNVEINSSVCTCEYCQTQQTIPRLDSDKKINLYDRANHYRQINEFDKAAAIYEQLLEEDTTDSEAYWSLVLCRYGIEYVEDPVSRKRVPTVNRTQLTSVFADEEYKKAIQYCSPQQKSIYENEASAIDEIQRRILDISQKEEPYDVFICYKETDESGRRTQDSVLANDIYYQLTKEGFKVFFSRITLEDKLGKEYEPYIFSAINSAKVMIVLGTKREYFDAVWVKNEWKRFLAILKTSNDEKTLIPAYKDMDPYDLPEEFSYLQAQDMGKLGFMQDLIRGIKKLIKRDEDQAKGGTYRDGQQVGGTGNLDVLLKRGKIALEDGEWDKADQFFEEALYQDAECAEAYLGKFLASKHFANLKELKDYCLTRPMETETIFACQEDAERLGKAVAEYAVEDYLTEDTIRQEYAFDRSFKSSVAAYRKLKEDILNDLSTDRLFLRARKYAHGETKKKLDDVCNEITCVIEEKLESEIKDDQRALDSISSSYAKHIEQAEIKVKELSLAAKRQQEEYYQSLISQMKAAKNALEYEKVGNLFEGMHGYKDSKAKAEECKKLAKRRGRSGQRKKSSKWVGLVAVALLIVILAGILKGVLFSGNTKSNSNQGNEEKTNRENIITDAKENYYGYGLTVDWNRSGRYQNYVVQDQQLYYSSESKIYRMPIGGTASDIQVLYDDKEWNKAGSEPIRIAVVKEWVYFSHPYDGLYRVKTDGAQMEELVEKERFVSDNYVNDSGRGDLSSYDYGCCNASFHVVGDKIYFIYVEELSGKEKSRHIIAYYDINTSEIKFWSDDIEEKDRILVGFENKLLVWTPAHESASQEWLRVNRICIWDIDRHVMNGIPGFSSIPKLFNRELTYEIDTDEVNANSFLHKTLTINIDRTHEFKMEDIHEESYWLSQKNKISSNMVWDLRNKMIYETRDGKLCYRDYANEDEQTWHVITEMDAKLIIAGFDDYVYFDDFANGIGWKPKYRVKRDGTGLEEVEWMFP